VGFNKPRTNRRINSYLHETEPEAILCAEILFKASVRHGLVPGLGRRYRTACGAGVHFTILSNDKYILTNDKD